MNPYRKFVEDFVALHRTAVSLPLGNIALEAKPTVKPDAGVALIFAPHPDDECVIGGLALRLMRELGMRVIDIAVTLGSNKARQQPRWQELSNACKWIGFELESTAPNGLEKISPATRSKAPEQWAAAVKIIAQKIAAHNPSVVFCPHEGDNNSTHMGTHWLVMDALKLQPETFECFVIETEFWGALSAPNAMVELSATDLADLLAALSFHVEEVKRNPYHLGLPSWMRDNVRRGAESVGGQGGAAPDFLFATLYRVRRWKGGRLENAFEGGKQVSAQQSLAILFEGHLKQ